MNSIRCFIVGKPLLLVFLLPLPAAGQSQLTCQRLTVPSAAIRAESMAEPVSDIVLNCAGGSPAATGAVLPQFEILVISNTPFANRTFLVPTAPQTDPLAPPAPSPNTLPWNDAFLLLDDPPPGSQLPCAPPAGADTCPTTGPPYPNVFQGRQLQNNTVLFRHVPINPPGDGGTRVIRITNLRVDATQIPLRPTPDEMSSEVQIFTASGDAVPIQNAEEAGADASPGYTFSVRTAADGAVQAPQPAVTTTVSQLSQSAGQSSTRFNVKFTEGLPDAFRRRNLGTSGDDPLYIVSQPIPGAILHTESGFLNAAYPQQNSMDVAGLADSGTRLKVVFENIPDNLQVYVGTRDVTPGTTGYSPTAPKALLTGTDSNGAGLFSLTPSYSGGLVQLPITGGTAMAVWEVVSSNPTQVEDFSFEVVLAASASQAPALGIGTVRGSAAPTTTTANGTDPLPVPRFQEVITPDSAIPAFQIAATLETQNLVSVSAASYAGTGAAPASVVAGFASGIPASPVVASGLSSVSGITVDVIDYSGVETPAQLISIPPNQVNYVLDKSTALGTAVVNVLNGGQVIATGFLNVEAVAPGLFSADGSGQGPAVGQVARIGSSGNLTTLLANFNTATGAWSTVPVDLGGSTDINVLSLYGTGMRGRSSLANVTLLIGGVSVPILFVGAQTSMAGVDLVTAGPLPATLQGAGVVNAVLTVDGQTANRVTMQFR